MEFDAIAHGDHDFLPCVLGLVELERLIADLARVGAPFRSGAAVAFFLINAVEPNDLSLGGTQELELHGCIEGSEGIFGLWKEFGFARAEGFHKHARTLERDGANEIRIIVENILPHECRKFVRRNLEIRGRSGFLRDGSRATEE
jgi:hypothetical protein